MAHQLRLTPEGTPGSTSTWRVDFVEDLELQIEAVLTAASSLPRSWDTTRFETDVAGLSWSSSGSFDQIVAVLDGCRQHGWPFVAYVRARAQDDPSTWSTDYTATYLGWWADRRAFAQEIAAAGAHLVEEDAVDHLDPILVDEICSGFLCLEVDGQIVVFDELLDR